MTLYMRFLVMLAMGLSGVTLILTIVMDRLFCDWDMFADIVLWYKEMAEGKHISSERAEDVQTQAEQEARAGASRYMIRKKQLKEIEAVETRLHCPDGVIVLTPLPRGPLPTIPTVR